MKKKKTLGKYEKGVIITGVAVLIIFLILLTADGIKNIGKNNNNLALSEQEEKITNTPNAPVLSAGTIPVKYDNNNLVICKNDNTWYNLSEGKPAYIMLNDGVYQSELTVDMTNKKLANENIGQIVPQEEQGSIYMWIPRFAQKQNGEIGYIKEEVQPGGEWIVPDTFSYVVADETKPNFSLSGIWIEKEPLASAGEVNTKITNMNKENNPYGLIANTMAVAAGEGDCPVTAASWSTGTVPDAITDPSNPNRTIIKVINTNKQEPIKANITQNTVANTIEIRVTYTKNGIREILDENGNKLTLREENGVILADTGEEELVNGKYSFTIIDNNKNKKELSIKISVGSIYTATFTSMDNTSVYNKAQETVTSDEKALLKEIQETDTSMTYVKAIPWTNGEVVAIGENERSSEDLQLYRYNFYTVADTTKYVLGVGSGSSSGLSYSGKQGYAYTSVSVNENTGKITLSGQSYFDGTRTGTLYSFSSSINNAISSTPPSSTASGSKDSRFYQYNISKYGTSMKYSMFDRVVSTRTVPGNSGDLAEIVVR